MQMLACYCVALWELTNNIELMSNESK